MRQSAILNLYGGNINLCVQPLYGYNVPIDETEDSSPLMTVVPTAHILFLFLRALLIQFEASISMNNSSESILCFDKSSTSTGLNVPKPTCNVISAKSIPLICNLFNRCFEKCKPAVGAATAPSCLAYIV